MLEPKGTTVKKWTRFNGFCNPVYLTKDYSPKVYIKIYMIDARWRFTISGRTNTKYWGFTVNSKDINRAVFKKGWKNLSNAKARALDALYWYYGWYDETHHEYETTLPPGGNLHTVYALDTWTQEVARTKSPELGYAYWGKMIEGKIKRAHVGPFDTEEEGKPKDATAVVWYNK